jgi:phosphatidylglycerol:prolipoprotein diacylglycerol transferase
MYPTVGHLLHFHLPIPTFGTLMVLAFMAAYHTFLAEFKRKKIAPAPSRLMDKMLFWCGITGFAGAILFGKLEQHYSLSYPIWPQLLHYNGLNYYGSLLAGATTYFIISARNGIPFPIAADIGSPGMMLAYAVGRLGCHLAGDGDWGITVTHPSPSWLPATLWSSTYPHNVIRQGLPIPGCTDPGNYCTQLPVPVYPTSLYEALVCTLLFFILWGLRRKIAAPGILFGIFALLNGLERFAIELIRINPRHAFLGASLSQAQIIALGCILTGIVSLYWFSPPASGGSSR